jgi:hypothetical protein
MGCAKSADHKAVAPAAANPASTVQPEPSVAGALSQDADPITRLAYKTGVSRDKVETILELYERDGKAKESGRDIYNIALLGSRATGISTREVGAVILEYRGLSESDFAKASKQAKAEASKQAKAEASKG